MQGPSFNVLNVDYELIDWHGHHRKGQDSPLENGSNGLVPIQDAAWHIDVHVRADTRIIMLYNKCLIQFNF